MDSIREAFFKVKQDVSFLQEELFFVKKDLEEMKEILKELVSLFGNSFEKDEFNNRKSTKGNPTDTFNASTQNKDIPTQEQHFNPLKTQNKGISTGNGGVPTDRQTDRQTDQQTHYLPFSVQKDEEKTEKESFSKDPFEEAFGALESLDNLKKELRLKFKRLTEQEFLVFSTIYQISEEKEYTDYKEVSTKLGLTESSIRDYVGKLIKKGIPVDKIKINNKSLHLKISSTLKKVASLNTILLLRGI